MGSIPREQKILVKKNNNVYSLNAVELPQWPSPQGLKSALFLFLSSWIRQPLTGLLVTARRYSTLPGRDDPCVMRWQLQAPWELFRVLSLYFYCITQCQTPLVANIRIHLCLPVDPDICLAWLIRCLTCSNNTQYLGNQWQQSTLFYYTNDIDVASKVTLFRCFRFCLFIGFPCTASLKPSPRLDKASIVM